MTNPEPATTPRRIKRRRTAGWTAPLDEQGRKPIYVGRGTRFGNPWAVVTTKNPKGWAVSWTRDPYSNPIPGTYWVRCAYEVTARQQATRYYAEWIQAQPKLLAEVRDLAGRDLMCWCAEPEPGEPDHCHAAVLLRVAAGGQP
ncbi:DUF4326 domain-containing protein [Streptantibioticus silvisoli]|uniref:DUF4326 domain-containing protein n=1 Tax=Streptantibioticus silvisoli TaxID=2705255 RepID=A0ABT6W4U9_9ACTN|nr:DUF4326 domain-containing protein [Streptantibioticus silvisoli]MDI5965788.1 DUF4326 domain-containing protein [Streptantibioticus silvisoli]